MRIVRTTTNMLRSIRIVLLIVFAATQFALFAQQPIATPKSAKEFMGFRDFKAAFKLYSELLKTEPQNASFHYFSGLCILEGTFEPKKKALPFLEKAVELKCEESDLNYQHGRAYHQAGKYNEAIVQFEKFLTFSKDVGLNEKAKSAIVSCKFAKEAIKTPRNVSIKNLGAEVNSPEPDYFPYVDESEAGLMFTTRRVVGNNGYMMEDGLKSADVFLAKEKNGVWVKAKSIGGTISTGLDEEIVGLSFDGQFMFLNIDSWETAGDIMVVEKKGKAYQKPFKMLEPINTTDLEFTASTNSEKNLLFFSSNRAGGVGGFDIYMARRLPSGEWGTPLNMGPSINSPSDEYFPVLIETDTLDYFYFSSNGKVGMGGFDIFVCTKQKEATEWEFPENVGYPVNTPDDDMQLTFTRDGRKAYMSSTREGGIGDLDIYELTFNNVEQRLTAVKGIFTTTVPIDFKDYTTVMFYEKDSIRMKAPLNFTMPEGWKMVESKKEELKPGFEYKASVVYEKDGKPQSFSIDKAPVNNTEFKFKEIKMNQVAIQNYKPVPKPKQTTVNIPIKESQVTIVDKTTNEDVGYYSPNPKTGAFVAILPPGQYELKVEAQGFKEVSKTFKVLDLGSYKEEMKIEMNLESLLPSVPVHYSEVNELVR